jgi:hypothetical protein
VEGGDDLDLNINQTRRTENYTVHRSFGRVTFAISDSLDRDFVYQQISGDKGSDLMEVDTIAIDIIGHNVPSIVQEDFISLCYADLLSVGMFSVVFNERVVSDNGKARDKLNVVIERITDMLDNEAQTSIMLEALNEVLNEEIKTSMEE